MRLKATLTCFLLNRSAASIVFNSVIGDVAAKVLLNEMCGAAGGEEICDKLEYRPDGKKLLGAKTGNIEALFICGRAFVWMAVSAEKDHDYTDDKIMNQGCSFLAAAAQRNSAPARIHLGLAYLCKWQPDHSPEEARKLFELGLGDENGTREWKELESLLSDSSR